MFLIKKIFKSNFHSYLLTNQSKILISKYIYILFSFITQLLRDIYEKLIPIPNDFYIFLNFII